MRLVDTNVLLYAASRLPEEAAKRDRARELFAGSDLFVHQATRSTRPGRLTHDDAWEFLGPVMMMPVQDVTLGLFRDAVAISQRFRLAYWDCAILAGARALGCDAVYSEDLSSEQDYDGLRVIDPFAGQ